MRSTLAVIILMLTAVALLFATDDEPDSNKPIKIAVSTTPLSTPFFIADELKLFAKHGVNVGFQELAGGHACFVALKDKTVQLATSSDTVLMYQAFANADFKILTSFVQSDNDVKLIPHPNANISSAQDLIGKRLGVIPGSASEYFLYSYLNLEGIDQAQVEIVPIPAGEISIALLENWVDLAAIWEPLAFRALETFGTVQPLPTKGLYNLSFNLVTDSQFAREQPEQVEKILNALHEATVVMANDPETAQRIIRKRLRLEQKFVDWVWPDYAFRLSLNHSLQATLRSEAAWAIEHQLVESQEPPPFEQFFYKGQSFTVTKPGH